MFYHWITHISANTYISYIQVNLKLRIPLILEGLASYLDLFLNIDVDGRLHTKIYDKRDDFNFPIINFPFLSSNIPSAPSYGVYISQLIRYSRACSHYTDFIYRSVLLTQKLLQQSYEEDRLKLTLRKFYGHHHDLVDPYDVSLTKLAKDIFTTW